MTDSKDTKAKDADVQPAHPEVLQERPADDERPRATNDEVNPLVPDDAPALQPVDNAVEPLAGIEANRLANLAKNPENTVLDPAAVQAAEDHAEFHVEANKEAAKKDSQEPVVKANKAG